MKVKIVEAFYADNLQRGINEFIQDKNVIDIKYSTMKDFNSALIIYEEVTSVHPIGETIPVEGGIK